MSPKSTSDMPPSDAIDEKPMPRLVAQSSTAVTTAPDCETKATLPFSGCTWPNEALSPLPGAIRPRQLGPAIRNRRGRAASSIFRCSAQPSSPSSPKPAVMTTAAFVPRAPSAAMRPGTVCGGVATTARSGASGRLSTSGRNSTSPTRPPFGLTAQTGPSSPAPRRLFRSTLPTEPARALAPIRATERGANMRSRLRIDMGSALRRRGTAGGAPTMNIEYDEITTAPQDRLSPHRHL